MSRTDQVFILVDIPSIRASVNVPLKRDDISGTFCVPSLAELHRVILEEWNMHAPKPADDSMLSVCFVDALGKEHHLMHVFPAQPASPLVLLTWAGGECAILQKVVSETSAEKGGLFGGVAARITVSTDAAPVGAFDVNWTSDVVGTENNECQPPCAVVGGEESSAPFPWKKGPEIGRGASGQVFSCIDMRSGALFAVKEVSTTGWTTSHSVLAQHMKEVSREIRVLSSHHHSGIVRYLGCEFVTRPQHILRIFTEYMAGGSLATLLENYGPLSSEVVCRYTKQILAALAYLHDHGVLHRDIKGANVFVSDKGTIKLGDFGSSKNAHEHSQHDGQVAIDRDGAVDGPGGAQRREVLGTNLTYGAWHAPSWRC